MNAVANDTDKKVARDNLNHAGEFTKIENTAAVYLLRGWFAALSGIPGALEAGDDAWAATTLSEHYTSELNSDPATRTAIGLEVQAELAKRATGFQNRLNDILGAETAEDERINAFTDQLVSQVITKIGL